jgi:hypothetical protein
LPSVSGFVNTFITGNRKLHVTEWRNDDIAVIGISDAMTISNPISAWDQSEWSLEIQQLTLPANIWNHSLLKDKSLKLGYALDVIIKDQQAKQFQVDHWE